MNTITVHPAGPRPDEGLVARARGVASSAISDARAGSGAVVGLELMGGESAIPEGGSVVGPAFTARAAADDNLTLHWAIEDAKPGDVIIVEIPPDSVAAIMGELVGLIATARGIAAIILDGPIRDRSELEKGSLPVYARRTCHVGPTKVGPGELHVPIRVGGVEVRDGDLVIADRDGITVVPAAEISASVEGGEKIMQREIGVREAVAAGTLDRSWVPTSASRIVVGGDPA